MTTMYSDMMSHGPTMFYPPPPTTQYFPASRAHCTTYSPSPEPPQMRASARPQLPQQRSRKRSRDQLEDDEREATFEQENTMDATPAAAPEPIYGEGMILIDPITRRPIGSDASSSTGTWAEQQLEEERRAAAAAAEQAVRDDEEMARALDRPAKASRLDMSSVRSGSPTTIAGLVAPTPLTPETPSAPVHDEAAMALGIGWRKIDASSDAALAGASKGWAKVIDNNFAQVSGAEILAKNSGSDAYFVKAHNMLSGCDAWYLFDGDLTQGRLLAHDIDSSVRNLNLNQFEGELMMSRISPEPMSHSSSAQTSTPTEVAMEM